MSTFGVLFACFVAIAHSLTFREPASTRRMTVSTALSGHAVADGAPHPTPMSTPEMAELRRRQNNQILFATIGTCGYLSGSPGKINNLLFT
jgi:hypothetical protein